MIFAFLRRLLSNVTLAVPSQNDVAALTDPKQDAQPRPPATDARKAECPHCHGVLKKVPGAKTKCPHCGQYMYVRTSPADNARKVVTKAEADRIEEEWALQSGTYELYVMEKEKVEQERQRLAAKFGKAPSDRDVQWGLLNKSILEHAKRGDWGLYRNDRFAMGEPMRKEQRFEQALDFYLEVCYIDLNGPTNAGGCTDPEILAEFPPFNPREIADLAPGVIDRMRTIIARLGLDPAGVKAHYVNYCTRATRGLRLPRSVDECWPEIEQALFGE